MSDHAIKRLKEEIQNAYHPKGMSTHRGKMQVQASDVDRLIRKLESAESNLASLTQELEQLRAGYAGAVEALRFYANGEHWEWLDADSNARIVLDVGTKAANALSSTPQSIKDVMDVLEAVKAYDSAISALEKEHGRKDMELTQHSKLVPIRELARKL